MLICSKCGGKKFHKKGFRNGVQLYRCVSELEDGTICGSKTQPTFVSDDEESEYLEVLTENVRLAKRAQKFQDKNRIESKSFRESARMENSLFEFISEFRSIVESNKIELKSVLDFNYKNEFKSVGIIHLSDLHFNELVDIIGNK